MRRGPVLLVLLLGALTVVGCTSLRGEVKPYRPPVYYGPPDAAAGAGPVDPGRYLYMRDCAFCHGDNGQGTDRAPALTGGTNGPALTDFVLRTGRMPVQGAIEQMRSAKPVYDENERSAIASFVSREFRAGGPEVPDVDPRRGKLSVGQELYEEHCASCHATTGIGGAMLIQAGRQVPGPTRGIVIPGLATADAQAIAEAVRTGPGSMPLFGERAIPTDKLDSLVKYVLYLRNPSDRGGAPIGRVGPVMEGAVGWLIGLGLLMLLIRVIGTKAGEVE